MPGSLAFRLPLLCLCGDELFQVWARLILLLLLTHGNLTTLRSGAGFKCARDGL